MELKLNFRMEATFPVSPLSEDSVHRQGEGVLTGKGVPGYPWEMPRRAPWCSSLQVVVREEALLVLIFLKMMKLP